MNRTAKTIIAFAVIIAIGAAMILTIGNPFAGLFSIAELGKYGNVNLDQQTNTKEKTITLTYNVLSKTDGTSTIYIIKFDDEIKAAGTTNTYGIDRQTQTITMKMSDYTPGIHKATLLFKANNGNPSDRTKTKCYLADGSKKEVSLQDYIAKYNKELNGMNRYGDYVAIDGGVYAPLCNPLTDDNSFITGQELDKPIYLYLTGGDKYKYYTIKQALNDYLTPTTATVLTETITIPTEKMVEEAIKQEAQTTTSTTTTKEETTTNTTTTNNAWNKITTWLTKVWQALIA